MSMASFKGVGVSLVPVVANQRRWGFFLASNLLEDRGTMTQQLVNVKITTNATILVEGGWEDIGFEYMIYQIAKWCVKICHFNKTFLYTLWKMNYNISAFWGQVRREYLEAICALCNGSVVSFIS
jgi:hypothetical protein